MQGSFSIALGALALSKTGVLGCCDSKQVDAFTAELRPLLSEHASVSFPGSAEFSNATVRWSTYGQPTFSVAVDVATDEDVRQTVKVANAYSLPFLATSGHHGAIKTLDGLNCGVDINLRKLNTVALQEDGQTATIQGGILTKEVTDALWEFNKWTVTPICGCTSLMGPALGGGHGWNQGRYGLALDQFVEVNLVLGDGSSITVSDSSHQELFWALRGAGHNFGIATSVRYRVYDVPENNLWTVGTYTYTQDKLEVLFELLNEFTAGGEQPIELRYWTSFYHDPSVDPINVSISVLLVYEGTEDQAAPYSSRLLALSPKSSSIASTTYPGLGLLTMGDPASGECTYPDAHVLRFPIGVRSFNLTAHRKAFDLFNNVTQTYPGLSGSAFLNEGYSVKAVQQVPADSTAYPERFNNLLLAATFATPPDPVMDQVATEMGLAIRNILLEGSGSSELNAYVNYAVGEEHVEDWYGHEEWRIAKLRALKAKYDPDGKFSFYAPIQ